jgi:hypothetical protein
MYNPEGLLVWTKTFTTWGGNGLPVERYKHLNNICYTVKTTPSNASSADANNT